MSRSGDLKRKKREVEAMLKKYEKRLREVQAIQTDVTNDFTNNVSDVNKYIDKVIAEENAGFHNHTHYLRDLGDVLEEQMEKNVGSDAHMKDVIGSLSDESTAVSDKIAELEQEIHDLEQAIAEAEAEEEEERKAKAKAFLGL